MNFQLLFFRQLLRLNLIFGHNTQKRGHIVLSSLVRGYYKENYPLFDVSHLRLHYLFLYNFFNGWFSSIQHSITMRRLLSGNIKVNGDIKSDLLALNIISRVFRQKFLFLDLRRDFFPLIFDLTQKLDQHFLHFWFPGLLSNFNALLPIQQTHFLAEIGLTPLAMGKKFLFLLEPQHIDKPLRELFSRSSFRFLKVFVLTNSVEHLWFQPNIFFSLPGNSTSFTCTYFYCTLFSYLFHGLLAPLNMDYLWLSSLESDKDFIVETIEDFDQLTNDNFFNFAFCFHGRRYRWGKIARRYKNFFFKMWLKFRRKQRNINFVSPIWSISKYEKYESTAFWTYDVSPFESKKWTTPSEFLYRKIRKRALWASRQAKVAYWHYLVKKLIWSQWGTSYNKLGRFLNRGITFVPFTAFPLNLSGFVEKRFFDFLRSRLKRTRKFFLNRTRILWWTLVFGHKLKRVDIHLVLSVYLLNTFRTNNFKVLHSWLNPAYLSLNNNLNLNLNIIRPYMNLPTKGISIHFNQRLYSYLKFFNSNKRSHSLLLSRKAFLRRLFERSYGRKMKRRYFKSKKSKPFFIKNVKQHRKIN